jgi:serine/threonine protein kinase
MSPEEKTKLCDNLRDRLLHGDQAALEHTLADLSTVEQREAFPALVQVERQVLGRSGQTPQAQAYRHRFPELAESLDSTLDEGETATADEPIPTIEGYRIVGELGRGGMGTVWRAVQLATDRHVALKIMASSLFESDKAKARFEREVKLAAKLEHPSIARVYDSGIHRGLYYYVMELIDGRPIDQYLEENGCDLPERLALMETVCHAVAIAHDRGIVHRDLKPSNVLITADGVPHLLDFGLAKLRPLMTRQGMAERARIRATAMLAKMQSASDSASATSGPPSTGGAGDSDATTQLQSSTDDKTQPSDGKSGSRYRKVTQDGDVAGTLVYMSPEQASGRSHDVDPRSDVYALGGDALPGHHRHVATRSLGKLPRYPDPPVRAAPTPAHRRRFPGRPGPGGTVAANAGQGSRSATRVGRRTGSGHCRISGVVIPAAIQATDHHHDSRADRDSGPDLCPRVLRLDAKPLMRATPTPLQIQQDNGLIVLGRAAFPPIRAVLHQPVQTLGTGQRSIMP